MRPQYKALAYVKGLKGDIYVCGITSSVLFLSVIVIVFISLWCK